MSVPVAENGRYWLGYAEPSHCLADERALCLILAQKDLSSSVASALGQGHAQIHSFGEPHLDI